MMVRILGKKMKTQMLRNKITWTQSTLSILMTTIIYELFIKFKI